ncbi:MAG: bifunctional metallophosphatase/5'-nucleotidase [Bacteroidota bacterium]|nr:bifunctional metallophosphatase/5'-nucleotidase [Bacteroidota bacterium]
MKGARQIFFLFFISTSLIAQEIPLRILHWNDFHAQNIPFKIKAKSETTGNDTSYFVGGSAALKAYIEQYSAGDTVLLLNAGDDFQGTPISTITKGASQITLMNMMRPDAVTIGNHEFDYGRKTLEKDFSKATYPIISANIVDKLTHKTFVRPYLVRTIKGIKIGIIGLMAPDLARLTLPQNIRNLYIAPAASTVKEIIPELKKKHVDLIIVLSHIGVERDSMLAETAPEISIIIGGHSHTPIFTPKKVNGVLICQAGSRGEYLGELDLLFDKDRDSILHAKGKLIEIRTADIKPDSAVQATVTLLEQKVDTALSKVIATLKSDWKRNRSGESNIGDWQTDVMRRRTKADIAFQNNGGIRKDVYAGPLTLRDMWEMNPFGNQFVTFVADGATLKKMIAWQAAGKGELCQVSGVCYAAEKDGKLVSLTVDGKPVQAQRRYSIVTNNYVAAHGKEFFGFENGIHNVKQTNILDRDAFSTAAEKEKVIDSKLNGRIVRK